MDDLQLLIDLHIAGSRQGPGSEAVTRQAIALSGLEPSSDLRIADIGCGTGASALVLARELGAHVTAVDFLPDFLDRLNAAAKIAGLGDRIEMLEASMDALPFEAGQFDAVWSEGAIYNIGFEAGAKAWKRYLKPGGILAVSELTWLTHDRPAELQAHWDAQYPEVDTASAKMAVLERLGYAPVGYFVLPDSAWLDHYYRPMQQRFSGFLDRHANSEAAMAIVAAEETEISLYERYRDFVSYGFYIARRVD